MLRTPTDTGPAITRQRYTAATVNVAWPIPAITGTQYQALESFFETDLENGALRFDITDPIDKTTVEVRFLEPPSLTAIRPSSDATERLWTGTLLFEILP